MVNNAGIEQPLQQVIETTEDVYREVLDTNLWGVIAGCRAAGRVMRSQGSGAVINTSSQLGKVAFETWGVYAASKAGVLSITQAMARELAATACASTRSARGRSTRRWRCGRSAPTRSARA